MRKWKSPFSYLIKMSFRLMVEYRVFFLMMAARLVIELGVLYYFWLAVFKNSPTTIIRGFTFPEMLTYMVLSVATLTLFKNSVDVTITEKIKAGVISLDLIKPVDFQLYHFFPAIGMVMFRFIFQSMPVLLCAGFIFRVQFFMNYQVLIWYLVSIILGVICMFLIDYVIGLASFWLMNNWGMALAKETIVYFFSGGVIPLVFFNKPLHFVADILPFKAVIHVPLSIGMGKFTTDMVFDSLLLQVCWIGILFVLSRVIWGLAQKKISIQGG